MSDIDKDTLKEKKQELEAELKSIQGELDDSIDRVKDDVSSSLSPSEHIRKHPLPAVGIAVVLGFLIGQDGEESHSSNSEAPGETLTSTLGYEAKRLLTRKAFSFISDYIDGMLHR